MRSFDKEISVLRRIDEQELRCLVGETIVSAVDKTYNTNVESILAEILVLKLGSGLLDNKILRSSLIDIADEQSVVDFTSSLGLGSSQYIVSAKKLREYFNSSYSEEKSKQFVDWLKLPETYYKKTITDERNRVESISATYGESISLKGYLHDYQKDVKDQILESLNNPGVRLMVQMPTGAGKTFTALETAVDILRKPFQEKFIVWLVNSNELAEQALQSFSFLWKVKGDRPIETARLFKNFFPEFKDLNNGGVVFASYDLFHSILSNIDDDRRDSLLYLISHTEYLIVDEAHAAIADTYEECIRAFINNDYTKIVGLSATPIREDYEESEALRRLFSNNLVSIRDHNKSKLEDPIRYLQDNDYLAHIKTETLDTGYVCEETNENKILKSLSEDGERNSLILKQIEYANSIGDKTLVFACTKDHVLALYIMCKGRGLDVDFITGDTPQSERPKILENFNSGDTNVLINLDILSTGIDLPKVNRLIITRPVRSSTQYSQIVGRALRGPRNGGNNNNTIVNILDNINYYGGISLLYSSFSNAWE
jgi:superfamily II DNA or RNA helicase